MVQIRESLVLIIVFVMIAIFVTIGLCKSFLVPQVELRWEGRGTSGNMDYSESEFLTIKQSLEVAIDSIKSVNSSEVVIHETEKGIVVNAILYPVHNESLTSETLDSIILLIQNSIANLPTENINIVVDHKS